MPSAPDTLPTLLAALVERHADDVALIDGDVRLSFADLEQRARRVAAGLAALRVGSGDRVAVWLPNGLAWAELEFALARLGAIAVAINTRFRAYEVQDILARSGARALALWPDFKGIDFGSILAGVDPAASPGLETLVLVGGGSSAHHGTPLAARRCVAYEELLRHAPLRADCGRPDAPCNVFTSSGTTSRPKLVLHAQRGIVEHSRAVADGFSYRAPHTVILGMLPLCGVFGFNTFMGALAAGRPTVLMSVFDGPEAVRLIEQWAVTHTNGTDEMLRRIVDAPAPPERIASWREAGFAGFTGDAVGLVARGDAQGKRFYQAYGSTEVQALLARQPAETPPAQRALAGGVPVSPRTDVRVRDPETGALLPPGRPGELEIRGPSVMVGYLEDPDAERRIFTEDGYVRSGDLGYLTGPGSFVYQTRLGDSLRLGGFLVSPREIEAYLEQLPGIRAAQVVGAPSSRGVRVIGFVVLEQAHEIDEAAVIACCRADLAGYKVPDRVVAVPRFPTTKSPNGEKVQRARLREMAAALLRSAEAPSGAPVG
jgi:fatty-acyl-CoA synthase